jgi:hypothetical protein
MIICFWNADHVEQEDGGNYIYILVCLFVKNLLEDKG